MVYAFMIQSLSQTNCDVLYYRVYSSYDCSKPLVESESDEKCGPRPRPSRPRHDDSVLINKLFETSTEKKELLNHVAHKIQMQYCLKIKHAILPGGDLKDSSVKGVYMERGWKEGGVPVIWQSIQGLGFVMICKESENMVQAHNVMDILIRQLEKHLQFVSSPVIPLKLVETIALIVNQFLPSGQLLFINSKLHRQFEKHIETDLFAK